MSFQLEIDDDLPRDQVLRRYLDLPKLASMLMMRSLYLCRSDLLPDRYEGAFTPSLKRKISESYKEKGIDFTYEKFKKELRGGVFLNCWTIGYDDNMALWKLYGKTNDCVAITTTVDKIRTTILAPNVNGRFYLRKVKYIKHWQDPDIPIKPYSNIFSYKLVGYSFEGEARIICDQFHETFGSTTKNLGVLLPINPSLFIRSIVVSPEASSWFLKVVKGIVEKYGVKCSLRRSMMAKKPI